MANNDCLYDLIEPKMLEIGSILQRFFGLRPDGGTFSAIVEPWQGEQQEVLAARMKDFLLEYVLPQDQQQAGQGWFYTCLPEGQLPYLNEIREEKGMHPLQEGLIWCGTISGSTDGQLWELHRHWDPHH
jgi:hypothetical protein